jgi:Asp-tRNA(Asn)/Glu-tRNA(Gln) amidotransferase A subunit family amidase
MLYNILNAMTVEELSIAAIREALKEGVLTARRLVKHSIDRIEAYDKHEPFLNSVITINPHALQEATALDERFQRIGVLAPLHGVTLVLKDNIQTADMPTTAGSESLAGWQPAHDAPIVRRLREAGAIIVAKVNLHEFALWGETVSSILGQTLNPYDPERTPGGSSGGTGAAVAAAFAQAGIGTDTVNSIRSPASACCLVGIKPTLGLVSRTGIVPYSSTQDSAGPMARSVADAARLLDFLAGCDPLDGTTSWCRFHQPRTYTDFLNRLALKGARIGVLESFFGTGNEHLEVNAITRRALAVMRSQGAHLMSLDEPLNADTMLAEVSVHMYELKAQLDAYLAAAEPAPPVRSFQEVIDSGNYHPDIEMLLRWAVDLSGDRDEYHERLRRREALKQQVMNLMAENALDAIIFPHQRRLVVPVGEAQVERQGVLAAATGFPSIVVPAGFSFPTMTAPLGVPIGLEIVGMPWSEPKLISIAYAFEQATQVHAPPVSTPPLPL